MTKSEILAELQAWELAQKRLDAQLDLFYDLTRAQPDSDLLTAIYGVAEAHTEAIGKLLGDKLEWLDWWKFETDYGQKKHLLDVYVDRKLLKIKTLRQLAGLIAE